MGLRQLLTDLSGVIDNINEDNVIGEYPHHDLFNKDGLSIFDNPYSDKLFNFRQKSLDFDTYLENPEWVPLINRVGGMFGNATETHKPIDEGVNAIIEGNIPDSEIRGGLTTFNNRRFLDKARFDKWLQTPTGEQWNSTQTLLQASNPKPNMPVEGLGNTQSWGQAVSNLMNADPNQTTWNLGINTGQQILSGGNKRIPREGITPFNRFHEGYLDYIPIIEKENMNRLVHLAEKTGLHVVTPEEETGKGKKALKFLKDVSKRANGIVSTLVGRGEELYSYLGGPGSKFGLGRTFIGRYTNTILDKYGKDHPFADKTRNYTWSQLDFREDKYGLGSPGVKINPDNLNGNISTEGQHAGEYIRTKNKEGKFTYNVYNVNKTDKINMLDIFSRDMSKEDNENIPKDFIKFRIEVINPEDPIITDYIVFRAYLDSISDDFSADHNAFKYNGRAESFYTYKSFNRDISLSFKIAAQTRHEMIPIYRKLNYLVAQTAPSYSSYGRMMTSFQRLTVGDMFSQIPGVIQSVGLSWQTDYPWEIRLDPKGEDKSMLQLPHVLDVSMKFKPIHDFIPENFVTSPFILPNYPEDFEGSHISQNWYDIEVPSADSSNPVTAASTPFIEKLNQDNQDWNELTTAAKEAAPYGSVLNPIETPIQTQKEDEITRKDLVVDKLKGLVSSGESQTPDSAFVESTRKRQPITTITE